MTALPLEVTLAFVKRRSCWLGVASLSIAFAYAPQAAAEPPEAKFKVVSASGRESLSFEEEGETSTGDRCVGTTANQVSWRATKPTTVYLFVKRVKGKVATILSADRVGGKFEFVPLTGEATVSQSVTYTETDGCDEPPLDCLEATVAAEPFLTGTSDPAGGVNGGVSLASGVFRCLADPFGNAAGFALPDPTESAFAIPRNRLLDPKRKRIQGEATVEEPVAGTYDAADRATVSGTYTDHLSITLKRLKLKKRKPGRG